MPSANAAYSRQLWQALLALWLLAIAFFVYVALEKRLDQANHRRYQSYQLADLLRQTSDDLTRMARSHVLTGDPRYRQTFEQIMAIRDGRAPWPEGYDGVYWDLVLAGARPPGRPGPRQPLLERMRAAGFDEAELALLGQAKTISDALTATEFRAMALAAGDAAERERARALLHDAEYHRQKAAIMGPIQQVLEASERRTGEAVERAALQATLARVVFVLGAIGMVWLLLRSQRELRRLLGGSVEEVHARINQIGRGDFGAPAGALPEESSVLGRLDQTRARLQAAAEERSQAQQRLQLAAGVFTHAREGIMITDAAGLIVDVNEAFCRLTGYSHHELVGRSPHLLHSGRHDNEFYEALWEELQRSGQWQGEIWDRRKNGELFATLETISAVRDESGQITHYITLMNDITAMKEQERRLEHFAHYDALTGLPNRVLLGDRLKHAMAVSPRHQRAIAVVYLDLDGFKEVNDRWGHEMGDRLLVALAGRLRHALREGDTLARLGGDEFVAVLLDLPDREASEPLLERMLREIAQPFLIEGRELKVSGSMGLTHYPQADEVDADQLLRQADQAMYQAKLAGKNRVAVFDAEQARQLRGQLETVESIRLGLEQGQFLLHYQPKVQLRSGAVVGVEALLRWQHPQRGQLLPGQFLPVIADHPLEITVGEWVIASALQQLADWRAQGLRLPVSVNISARHLQQTDFVGRVLGALQRHPGLRPQDLQFEVLESSALEDLAGVSQTIHEARGRGLAFALDDFGTGYSSLTYLKRLPVAQLKIDQSFVRDMLEDPDDLAILDGVIGLAAAFRREVIAEGVESVEHGAVLLQLGCELAQGYGIARPMPAAELPAWLAGWRAPEAWRHLDTVRREDLPLLRASVEYQSWYRGLLAHLDGRREQRPSGDPQDTRLGDWLRQALQQDPLRAAALQPYYQTLLQRAAGALNQRTLGGQALGPAELAELQAAHWALAQRLHELLQAGSRVGGEAQAGALFS